MTLRDDGLVQSARLYMESVKQDAAALQEEVRRLAAAPVSSAG